VHIGILRIAREHPAIGGQRLFVALEGVEISHSIVGTKATIRKSVLKNSLIGDDAIVEGVKGEVTVGDHSEVHAS
jgi:NDP-sugar pyrophosphorylase family protein